MLLVSDSTVVHDMSYKIAYNITSWLPFVVVAIIAIAIINKQRRNK
jgi:thiamine transporter ThiT